jgi:hypothetical protein
MDFESHDLKGAETEEIVSALVDRVVKSSEEIEEEEQEAQPSRTELKVFVAENRGFEVGTLSTEIEALASKTTTNKNIQTFITEHNVSETVLNEEVSFVEIATPSHERVDQFIFITRDDYLKIITAERREWTKKTVERLITYLPSVDRLFLSSEDLEEIVETLPGATISGFTAKYNAYHSDKSLTITFHGGNEDDLETVKEEFGAKPTRLEFSQSNSPMGVVQSSIGQNGYYKHTSVLEGYEDLGRRTLEEIFEAYEDHDRQHFAVEFTPIRKPVKSGFTYEGYTTLLLTENEQNDSQELTEQLEEQILDGKQRYKYSTWDTGNYLVFDTEHNEPFEIGVEGRDLALHAKEATSSVTFRDFCHLILEKFNSSYRMEKQSAMLQP